MLHDERLACVAAGQLAQHLAPRARQPHMRHAPRGEDLDHKGHPPQVRHFLTDVLIHRHALEGRTQCSCQGVVFVLVNLERLHERLVGPQLRHRPRVLESLARCGALVVRAREAVHCIADRVKRALLVAVVDEGLVVHLLHPGGHEVDLIVLMLPRGGGSQLRHQLQHRGVAPVVRGDHLHEHGPRGPPEAGLVGIFLHECVQLGDGGHQERDVRARRARGAAQVLHRP
mmetsp:Transcript_45489/g.144684  ORF Transcript_45489/g.144684 Transcript_45489/m.144684 type:complete len:229 (+) Transcript_45489:420-1106(+)